MKILFNCINNVAGGGVQNSANFISFALKDSENEYLFMVSPNVNSVLQSWGIEDDRITVFENRKKIVSTQIKIRSIEKSFSPDLVYTMAGPSFVFFKNYHVLGTSNPYITHAKINSFFLDRNIFNGIKMFLLVKVLGALTRLSGNYFIFQTPTSRLGFCRRFFSSVNKTELVPNAIGSDFIDSVALYKPWTGLTVDRVLLCPSAYYPHKNIEILFKVARLLKAQKTDNVTFVLTVDDASFDKLAKRYPDVLDLVSNIGPYNYSNALSVYKKADAIVLPSLLETFSTVYIEAMALGLPLFVPREDFAEDICQGYGIYYNSLSEVSLYEALRSEEDEFAAANKNELKEDILENYGTQEMRYSRIIGIFDNVLRKK